MFFHRTGFSGACLWILLLGFLPGFSFAQNNPISVNPNNRKASRIFHSAIYPVSENADPAWTGDIDTGVAGTTAAPFKEKVRLRVNYFRAFAGVPAGITFQSTLSAKAQEAALMMAANRSLSHNPPSSWTFYTANGAEAASKSNLCLGTFGPGAIDGYVEDEGAANNVVGHRRWLFFPQTLNMGTGDIPESGDYLPSNALWVIDSHSNDARPSTRESFVAWPPPGFVPKGVVYPRWSFSYAAADFSATVVSMTRGSTNITCAVESRGSGAGENTIVWTPNVGSVTPTFTSDVIYTVTLSAVKIGGVNNSFTYSVKVFDPVTRVGETSTMGISGDTTPAVNTDTTYNVAPLALATKMQARVLKRRSMGWTEGAENSSYRVSFTVDSSYSPTESSVKNSGTKSFHLAQPEFEDQFITVRNQVLPTSQGSLTFYSRLRYSTSAQVARVQASADGGANWYTLWSQAGTGGAGETTFTQKTVSLSQFANRPVLVRFLYDFTEGSGFPQTTPDVGWLIDDIKFKNCQELSHPVLLTSSGNWAFNFHPTTPGRYYLQARPLLFNQYYAGWESGRSVTAQ